jgi:hypothetical protein
MLKKSYDSLKAGKGIPAKEFWKIVEERSGARNKVAKQRKRAR